LKNRAAVGLEGKVRARSRDQESGKRRRQKGRGESIGETEISGEKSNLSERPKEVVSR